LRFGGSDNRLALRRIDSRRLGDSDIDGVFDAAVVHRRLRRSLSRVITKGSRTKRCK